MGVETWAGCISMVGMEQQPRRGRGGRGGGFGGGFGGRGGYGWEPWRTDFPDSDLNFSFRLQQLTSLKVNPNPIHRRLTDPDLCDYPFIYMIEPGRSLVLAGGSGCTAALSAQRRLLDGRRFLGRLRVRKFLISR